MSDDHGDIAARLAALKAVKATMPVTADTEYDKAAFDAVLYGTGFMINGRRVAPEHVRIITPPQISIRDTDALCSTCRWRWNHDPRCAKKDEPWPRVMVNDTPAARDIIELEKRLNDA